MVLVIDGRSRIVRTSAKEDVIIAAVWRAHWRSSRDIALELELSQIRVHELLYYDQIQSYHYTRRAYLLPDDRSLALQVRE